MRGPAQKWSQGRPSWQVRWSPEAPSHPGPWRRAAGSRGHIHLKSCAELWMALPILRQTSSACTTLLSPACVWDAWGKLAQLRSAHRRETVPLESHETPVHRQGSVPAQSSRTELELTREDLNASSMSAVTCVHPGSDATAVPLVGSPST